MSHFDKLLTRAEQNLIEYYNGEDKETYLNLEDRFKIVTICGSTKFKDEFREAERDLSLAGWIVLTCNLFNHAEGIGLTAEQKQMLDDMHKVKINMSKAIYVINKNDYIGESTASEIKHAQSKGKDVIYAYKRGE